MTTIYTIGYGNRSMEDFIQLLKRYQIEYLIDVQSVPLFAPTSGFYDHLSNI